MSRSTLGIHAVDALGTINRLNPVIGQQRRLPLAIAGADKVPQRILAPRLGAESGNPARDPRRQSGVESYVVHGFGYLLMIALSQFARSTVTNPVATARIDNAAATAYRRLRRRIRLV